MTRAFLEVKRVRADCLLIGASITDSHLSAIAACVARPTTLGGAIALLAYVDEFNRGFVRLEIDQLTSRSERELWPDDLTDDAVKTANGKPLEAPFEFWLLRNVQAALQSIAAQA